MDDIYRKFRAEDKPLWIKFGRTVKTVGQKLSSVNQSLTASSSGRAGGPDKLTWLPIHPASSRECSLPPKCHSRNWPPEQALSLFTAWFPHPRFVGGQSTSRSVNHGCLEVRTARLADQL